MSWNGMTLVNLTHFACRRANQWKVFPEPLTPDKSCLQIARTLFVFFFANLPPIRFRQVAAELVGLLQRAWPEKYKLSANRFKPKPHIAVVHSQLDNFFDLRHSEIFYFLLHL
jgi:hypothetical protein